MRCSVKIKPLQNDEIALLFTDIDESYPSREFLMLHYMSFNAIRENRIPVKIYEFTVKRIIFQVVKFGL